MTRKLPILIFLLASIIGFSQSQSYYNGLDLTKTGDALFLELSAKLKATHNAIPYTGGANDAWSVLMQADEDPQNPNNVLLIYGFNDFDGVARTDRSRNKNERDTGGGDAGKWNREHVYPKSLATPSLETDSPGPGTDVHNLRPADAQQNEARSNRKFTDGSGNPGIVEANGGWYPGDEWKGDVARVIMYMYLRYDGDGSNIANTKTLPIDVAFGTTVSSDPNMIELFLKWNAEDPVSDFEDQRNPIIEGIQGNRNPFIDNPYLATLIWGGIVAEDRWNMGGSDDSEAPSKVVNIQPVEVSDEFISLSWDASTDNEAVYDYLIFVDGVYAQSATNTFTTIENLTPDTSYDITIVARDTSSNLSEVSDAVAVSTRAGSTYLIREDFEDCSNLVFVAVSEASNKDWICYDTFGEENTGSIGINGYQEDTRSEDWLITAQKLDFDANSQELLSFYSDAAFGNTPLTLEYSSDYDGGGNPSDFTWTAVPGVNIPIHSDGSGNEEVYTFENVDISSVSGQVYIAFKYFSSGDNQTRWTVDNFEIQGVNGGNDSDGDGVLDGDDLCPNTPSGSTVDENGCTDNQLDDDNDGVPNWKDLCANTPSSETANDNGCSDSQLDDDYDGVTNDKDLCNNTPANEVVDSNGCAESQKDDDNDGVTNDKDECPNTPVGAPVNSLGCFALTASNFTIETTSETCPDQNNGIIEIEADESYEYVASFNGTDLDFTSSLIIENVEPGTYELCISVKGTNYEQCFSLMIAEGTSLLAKSSTQGKVMTVEIESGTAPFTVLVNDIVKFQTDANRFDIPINGNDKVVVETSKSCEGIFEKTFIEELLAYPNPVKDHTSIRVLSNRTEVQTTIMAVDGSVILSEKLPVVNGQINISTVQLRTGMYFVKLELETTEVVKIIKE